MSEKLPKVVKTYQDRTINAPAEPVEETHWGAFVDTDGSGAALFLAANETVAIDLGGNPLEYEGGTRVAVVRRTVTFGPWEIVHDISRAQSAGLCDVCGVLLMVDGSCRSRDDGEH